MVSFKFLKINLMIICKFVFQGYIMSMVIKSLLLNFVAKYQFYPFNLFENDDISELFEHNYRGFCPPPKWDDKARIQSIKRVGLIYTLYYIYHLLSPLTNNDSCNVP